MISTRIFLNPTKVAAAAAGMLMKELSAVINEHGAATWVIAGGSTPMLAYKLLADSAIRAVDWSKLHIIIGDERCVPFDNPGSNWSQAKAALLDQLALSAAVIRPQSDRRAEEAAELYEQYLIGLPKDNKGSVRLDVVWLGVGEDGHTLSLFPNHPSSLEATSRLVVAVHNSPKPPPDRISLTFKALQGASHCVIMAAGAGKAAVIARALAGDESLPIARAAATVHRSGGTVTWLLDNAAAEQI